MGRFYFGQIAGKFWVGVQDSNDASSFGVEPEFKDHYCYTCGCEGFEAHSHEADEYDGECEDCNCDFVETVETNEDEFDYYFDYSNVEYIQEVLDDIKLKIPDIEIPTFNKDDSYEYDVSWVKDELSVLKARWYLGQQILACIADEGECSFTCEC